MRDSMTRRRKKTHYNEGEPFSGWRETLHEIIFGVETPLAKAFDLVLIVCILLSVLAVMLGSVGSLQARFGQWFYALEWFFTLLFSIEFILRLLCVRKPWLYLRSFFGVVDFLAIIPTYLVVLFPSIKYMLMIRVLRLLRIFRVLKLSEYMGEARLLLVALSQSRKKILVFLYAVGTLVIIFGSIMYVVEGSEAGFTSIPRSVYWAIVTMTTVGYGDIAPQTVAGQMVASLMMIVGYGIIAVPTGIYSAELIKVKREINNNACPDCGAVGHEFDANFCRICGHALADDETEQSKRG